MSRNQEGQETRREREANILALASAVERIRALGITVNGSMEPRDMLAIYNLLKDHDEVTTERMFEGAKARLAAAGITAEGGLENDLLFKIMNIVANENMAATSAIPGRLGSIGIRCAKKLRREDLANLRRGTNGGEETPPGDLAHRLRVMGVNVDEKDALSVAREIDRVAFEETIQSRERMIRQIKALGVTGRDGLTDGDLSAINNAVLESGGFGGEDIVEHLRSSGVSNNGGLTKDDVTALRDVFRELQRR